MSTVRESHNKAMHFSQLALASRERGEIDESIKYAEQACRHEIEAASLIPLDFANEPTRSILYRSAASLAFQAKDYALSQRLIAQGLSGYPPKDIERELKELYQQVTFEDHLRIDDLELSEDDIQFSLAGQLVGPGMVLYEDFYRRMNSVSTLINRTMERLLGRKYQASGKPSRDNRPFPLVLSTAHSRSYAVTIRLTVPEQQQIPLLVTPAQVIDEVITGIEYINNSEEEALKQHIGDNDYYQNFVAMTKDLSPDGEKISTVGFSSTRKSVALQRKRQSISIEKSDKKGSHQYDESYLQIIGYLDYANSRKGDIMGITTEEKKEYSISVDRGMEDLVKNYFKQWVSVSGTFDGKVLHLENIEPATE